MRCLFVASECYPLIKTGGLADVAGALAPALAPLGCEARVLLPAYPAVAEKLEKKVEVARLPDLFGGAGRLVQGRAETGLEVLALEAPHLFDRPGNPYLGKNGKDWPDNHLRFAALSWAAREIALGNAGTWRPDLVHAHDWQSGLVPAYLRFSGRAHPPVVFTIHNLAFQGLFPKTVLKALRLPAESFVFEGLEYWDQISCMKAGLVYSDHITTVSPTYASEIQTDEWGMGLQGVLRGRAGSVSGIVNGIDETVWDPASDPAIDTGYGPRSLTAKAANRRALQAAFGLRRRRAAPLFCVVSRLTEQKGLDLLLEALPLILSRRAQLAVLGSGDPAIEKAFVQAAERNPGQVGVVIGYDEPLSHRMQAGADAIIIPSRFEPCGLTQLYGLRYGTLPVVARVGGLADTVIDANLAALRDRVATGFQFSPVTADALRAALARACDLYQDRRQWRAVQRRAMSQDVGWATPATAYDSLYRALLADSGAAAA